MITRDVTFWSKFLPWVKYAYNSQLLTLTGMCPFQCCLGYQLLLFPVQEEEADAPHVQHLVCGCKLTLSWATRTVLPPTNTKKKKDPIAVTLRPGKYRTDQRVMLATRDIPLKTWSFMLLCSFIRLFTITNLNISCLALNPLYPEMDQPLLSCLPASLYCIPPIFLIVLPCIVFYQFYQLCILFC